MKTILIISLSLCSILAFSQKRKDFKESKLFKIYRSNYSDTELTEKEVIKTAKCIKTKRKLLFKEMIYFSSTPKQYVLIPEDKELERSTQRMQWNEDFNECYYKLFPESNKQPY